MYICTHYKSIKVTLTQVATGRNGNIKGERVTPASGRLQRCRHSSIKTLIESDGLRSGYSKCISLRGNALPEATLPVKYPKCFTDQHCLEICAGTKFQGRKYVHKFLMLIHQTLLGLKMVKSILRRIFCRCLILNLFQKSGLPLYSP